MKLESFSQVSSQSLFDFEVSNCEPTYERIYNDRNIDYSDYSIDEGGYHLC